MSDNKGKKPYITVTHGMRGWFAVKMWWNPKEPGCGNTEGFWEPWQTGVGSYRSSKEAEPEAKLWAESEGIEYKP